MIRGGSGAETTPCSSHDLQARFSRLLTSTKYFAGSTSSWELSSWPITTVSLPQPWQTHCSGVHFRIRSTRGRFAGSSCRPGCWRFVFVEGWTAGRSLSAWTSTVLTPGSWYCGVRGHDLFVEAVSKGIKITNGFERKIELFNCWQQSTKYIVDPPG